MYKQNWRPPESVDDLIRGLLSVVGPHVEALEAAPHPLAAMLGERLRRSLWRLEPLLDEALAELKTLKQTDLEIAACSANLRDCMREAHQVLLKACGKRCQLPAAFQNTTVTWDEFSPSAFRTVEQWESRLRKLGDKNAVRLSRGLSDTLQALMEARHHELRARMVLDDAHGVLRHALKELADVGRACEQAFPDLARRIIPRPLEVAEDPGTDDRFNVH
jgi:hypothetical protein